jgi:hypothetical protein
VYFLEQETFVIALSIFESEQASSSGNVPGRVAVLRSQLHIYRSGFAIPCASGMKAAFARLIQAIFVSLPEPVIYISDWELWSPNQDFDLFNSYRLAKGTLRSLDDAPVHQFESANEESFGSIVCLVLYYQWDAEIFDRDGKCLITISHDEWLDIRTDDSQIRQLCDQAVSEGILKELRS